MAGLRKKGNRYQVYHTTNKRTLKSFKSKKKAKMYRREVERRNMGSMKRRRRRM